MLFQVRGLGLRADRERPDVRRRTACDILRHSAVKLDRNRKEKEGSRQRERFAIDQMDVCIGNRHITGAVQLAAQLAAQLILVSRI